MPHGRNTTCRYCGAKKEDGAVISRRGNCIKCGVERAVAAQMLGVALAKDDYANVRQARAILGRRSLAPRGVGRAVEQPSPAP